MTCRPPRPSARSTADAGGSLKAVHRSLLKAEFNTIEDRRGLVRRLILDAKLEAESVAFRQRAQVHRCGNALHLLGEALDRFVPLRQLPPVTPRVGRPVIGRVDADAGFDLPDPWSGADVIMVSLVDDEKSAFGKADVRVGMAGPKLADERERSIQAWRGEYPDTLPFTRILRKDEERDRVV